MSVTRGILALVAMAGLVALAGCGNRTDQGVIFKSLTQGLRKDTGQSGTMTPEQAAAAIKTSMEQTDLPLALAVVEDRNAIAVLANIESNGSYRTWGTSDRRTVTTRGGIVTATRGLGNDIMSSSIGGVASLINGRKAGSGQHVLRFLNGENLTVQITADCQVARGGQKRLSGGEFSNILTTEMTETCTAEGVNFANSYFVDGRGRVIQSRQWLGEANGYISIQLLR